MALYSSVSPYYSTQMNGNYLGIWVDRPIPKLVDDIVFTIPPTYNLRPDLLAYDLYDDAGLWWVFAARNPNTITDPLGDFQTGTIIYLPQLPTLKSALGF